MITIPKLNKNANLHQDNNKKRNKIVEEDDLIDLKFEENKQEKNKKMIYAEELNIKGQKSFTFK